MLERARALLGPFSRRLTAWCSVLSLIVALLRLVYPIAIVLVEQAWAGSAIVLATFSIVISAIRGLTADRATRLVRERLFNRLTAAIESYPALAPHGAPPIEQLESEIAKGVPWVEALVAVTVPSIIGNAVAIPIIAWLSWMRVGTRATLIAAGAMSCGVALGAVVARQVGKLGTIAWQRYQSLARLIESGFRGRVELGVHQRSGTHRANLLATVARWSAAERRLFVWGGMTGWLVPAATALVAIVLISIAGHDPFALLQQVLGQPTRAVVAAGLLALTALPALSSLSRGVADLSAEWPHVEALARFVSMAPVEKLAAGAQLPVQEPVGAIRADSVRFEYPSRLPAEPSTVIEANVVWGPCETLAIIGPNGCGKTTLTWLLMGIIEPEAGTVAVEVAGASYPPAALAGRVAYLPQQPYFDELQSVDDAIRFVAPNATDGEVVALVSELLEDRYRGDVRLLLERKVLALSVGERRIVALARVLLRKSELVILDEPEANLDGLLRQRVIKVLLRAKRERRMLLVTHDDAFAAIADRVYRMPTKH